MLTVFTVALGVLMAATLGKDALFIYFFQLPVALTLLWVSTSAERCDEGHELERHEREHEREREAGRRIDALRGGEVHV